MKVVITEDATHRVSSGTRVQYRAGPDVLTVPKAHAEALIARKAAREATPEDVAKAKAVAEKQEG